jgi:hypothetical protein
VSYRPWLEERALRQMGNLPAEALDVLVRALVRICEDPYDRLFSMAVRADDSQERMAELGDLGFIEPYLRSSTHRPLRYPRDR